RRTSIGRLIARNRRTRRVRVVRSPDGGQLVERTRAESARVDLNALVSRIDQRLLEERAPVGSTPPRELVARQLDARQFSEMPHPQVAHDSELSERRFGALHTSESSYGHGRAVWNT